MALLHMQTPWDERYAPNEFQFGTEPNDFLREQAERMPPNGNVLCLGDGEGRNGVYLASLGHAVTSVDLSSVGLRKAQELAAERGMSITTVQADLAEYDLGVDRWDAVVSIFCHLPPPLRKRIHSALVTALRPGGVYIIEGYVPLQLEHQTGGPPTEELMITERDLREELKGLSIELCHEIEREIHEGPLHNGISAVAQCVARR